MSPTQKGTTYLVAAFVCGILSTKVDWTEPVVLSFALGVIVIVALLMLAAAAEARKDARSGHG